MAEGWLASAVGSFIILLGNGLLSSCFNKVHSFIYPYDHITINEHQNQHLQRDELYTAAEAYLSSACSSKASKLKAEMRTESNKPVVTIDDGEEITDNFRGTRIWWYTRKRSRSSNIISLYPQNEDIKSYQLIFHKRRRKLVEGEYLTHIFEEGRAAMLRNRQRKLFTNDPSSNWYTHKSSVWSHIAFGHPATFDTLAMDPEKKKAILDDLITFPDVAEELIPKRSRNNDVGACLKNLIQVIAKKKADQAAEENFEGESSAQKAFDLEDDRSIDGIKN
ncbi:P-loop containing nucleoside triphosphate hydrolases superfamily protein [Rhynchospora pubera]|uniref:P-loop containing nucleoside triphosphate hydrolases superfamily protein n=1 Tax=Rhynchospora pubera TaxID=906938 RepID=A0AAV8G221_9POAL|nr:P-loop containing nucleoside triphosphate hydrolases superfamily protein [Rhynchospora pubera]